MDIGAIMEKQSVLRYAKENLTKYHKLSLLVTRFLEWQIYKNNPNVSLLKPKYRAKSVSSIEKNYEIGKYSEVYSEKGFIKKPRDIIDLAGGRLIFSYRDELESFVKVMNVHSSNWFGGKPKMNSKLKREGQRMVRVEFGYDSYHTQIGIYPGSEFWECLKQEDKQEFEGIDPLYCEIQLRTILQDVFGEAAHKFHYKVEQIPTPDKTALLGEVAAQLEGVDRKLDEIKKASEKYLPKESFPVNCWEYREPEFSEKAYEHNLVKYPYELIFGAEQEPELEVTWDLFNIDYEMLEKAKIENYKETIWASLEPEHKNRISYDTIAVRASSLNHQTGNIKIQPAKYSDQAVSNHKFALSKKINDRTVSSLALDSDGRLLEFAQSPMSNTYRYFLCN